MSESLCASVTAVGSNIHARMSMRVAEESAIRLTSDPISFNSARILASTKKAVTATPSKAGKAYGWVLSLKRSWMIGPIFDVMASGGSMHTAVNLSDWLPFWRLIQILRLCIWAVSFNLLIFFYIFN